mgnify:CR=1 FL=1
MENMTWDENNCTAVTYAARNDNIAMLEHLLKSGAILNTRRLPLGDAVYLSSPQTIDWLIAHGARVNRWKDDRYAPLQTLIWRRGEIAGLSKDEYRAKLKQDAWPLDEGERERMVSRHLSVPDYLKVAESLLRAGAGVDAGDAQLQRIDLYRLVAYLATTDAAAPTAGGCQPLLHRLP